MGMSPNGEVPKPKPEILKRAGNRNEAISAVALVTIFIRKWRTKEHTKFCARKTEKHPLPTETKLLPQRKGLVDVLILRTENDNYLQNIKGRTRRTQIDSFAKRPNGDVWGGGGKRTGRFQNFCFIDISPENFQQETLFCSICLLYLLLVLKNFDSSDIHILSVFVEYMVMKSTSLDFTRT